MPGAMEFTRIPFAAFEQEILEQMVFHPDGSVAEW
jgi:hypothetical protein